MIINNESILFKIEGTRFPAKDLLFIDAIRHISQMIDISYNRLIHTLSSKDNNLKNELATIDGWSIIGSLNRLRILLEKMPNISRKLLWYKKYYQKIKSVKGIRDFLEHFDEKVQSQIDKGNFTLGHISWLELKDDNSIVGNLLVSLRPKSTANLTSVNPAGKAFRWKIDHVTFYIGESEVNLSDMYSGLIEFVRNFEVYLENKIKNTI